MDHIFIELDWIISITATNRFNANAFPTMYKLNLIIKKGYS